MKRLLCFFAILFCSFVFGQDTLESKSKYSVISEFTTGIRLGAFNNIPRTILMGSNVSISVNRLVSKRQYLGAGINLWWRFLPSFFYDETNFFLTNSIQLNYHLQLSNKWYFKVQPYLPIYKRHPSNLVHKTDFFWCNDKHLKVGNDDEWVLRTKIYGVLPILFSYHKTSKKLNFDFGLNGVFYSITDFKNAISGEIDPKNEIFVIRISSMIGISYRF